MIKIKYLCSCTRILSSLKRLWGWDNPPPEVKKNIQQVGPCMLVIRDPAFHSIKNKPNGVIAVDFDETLFDYRESKKQKKIIFKNYEKWLALLNNAKAKNFMIILVTSRYFEIDRNTEYDYLRINEALNIFSTNDKLFSAIYYTNAKPKSIALKDLNKRIYDSELTTCKKIILSDDLTIYRNEVKYFGFETCDGNYPERLQPFISRWETRNNKTPLLREEYVELANLMHSSEKLSPT